MTEARLPVDFQNLIPHRNHRQDGRDAAGGTDKGGSAQAECSWSRNDIHSLTCESGRPESVWVHGWVRVRRNSTVRLSRPARIKPNHRKMMLRPGLLKYVLEILAVSGAASMPKEHSWNAP
jgi:hypothetical protein